MKLSKTLTKRDCDQIIKNYENMKDEVSRSIDCLKNLCCAIDNCKETVREMKESINEIDGSKRKLFRETVQKYLELHDFKGVFTKDDVAGDVTRIEYIDKDGDRCMHCDGVHGWRPCRTLIYWSEVEDLHNLIDSEIKYINHYILKKDD